jgi:hypothetical protein
MRKLRLGMEMSRQVLVKERNVSCTLINRWAKKVVAYGLPVRERFLYFCKVRDISISPETLVEGKKHYILEAQP